MRKQKKLPAAHPLPRDRAVFCPGGKQGPVFQRDPFGLLRSDRRLSPPEVS